MFERDMEDLIQAFPDDFFPDRGFKYKDRQRSFAGVGRFDLLFEDRYNRNVLMELKAVVAKSDAVDQLIRYQDELRRLGESNIVLWLVAPLIPKTLVDLLDRFGIEYKEIHVAEYVHVAERHGLSIRVEPMHAEAAIEKPSVRIGLPRNQERFGFQVPIGPQVALNSAFRWKAYGHDLALASSKDFDSTEFLRLVEAFQGSVPSKRNARLVDDLKKWSARPDLMHWSHRANASLLRWVTTGSYKTAVPHAFAIWKYLFGEPAPTWYVWHQDSGYEFDAGAWKIWFDSLNQNR